MKGETGSWNRPEMPDARGHFGRYGGVFVPETLITPLAQLEAAYREARADPTFDVELDRELRTFAGRPTPLAQAERLSESLGGARVYLKREDLAHTGAHKINNTVGQILLARRMGKTRVIAETGAGQHGVATAVSAARYGMACTIYMGSRDMERQAVNVDRMRLLGCDVRGVDSGSRTLKDAINECMRDWSASVRTTHYVLGSVLGPHPYPMMVRDFQSVIGREARKQCIETIGHLPDMLVACVGGGSNAIGLFHPFLLDAGVAMVGVEAGGLGTMTDRHAARFSGGTFGILHGTSTIVMQDRDGQIRETHSISAGLDYPAVGPEHALLQESGRVRYESIRDDEALDAFHRVSQLEGILPALESCHALAWTIKHAPRMARVKSIVVNLSGRGDKDLPIVKEAAGR